MDAVVPAPRISGRWLVAAGAMGALGAFAAAVVRLGFRGLEWILAQTTAAPPVAAVHLAFWRRALTPVVGGLLATLVLVLRRRRARRLGREPRPYVDYVEAVRQRKGVIPLVPNCWRTLSAAFSVASGAAVGREGSMIQFAAAGASVCGGWLSRKLGGREPLSRALLVALGVAGGVTTAYNAPVAAVFFAAEIVLGKVDLLEIPLLATASAVGWAVSGSLLGFKRLYPTELPNLGGGWTLLLVPALAVLFGVLGPLYQKLIRGFRVGRRLPLALACSGLVVGLASIADPRVWGNGDVGLSAALGRAEIPGLSITAAGLATLLALRLVATTACVGTGTVGGVFTPTLFAGGVAGALLAHAVPSASQALWAVAGMSLLMAAVTHAPLMAGFMAVELTGEWKLLPLLLVGNLIAWQVARRLSAEALYAIASQTPAHSSAPARGSPAQTEGLAVHGS